MTKYLAIIFLCTYTMDGFSQFVKDEAASNAVRNVIEGTADWGDYDNDGDLDLAICGADGDLYSEIYRNDNGTFVDIGAGLPGLDFSTIMWGDFDNDNDLDLFLAGMDSDGTGYSIIYRNEDGIFVDYEAGLTGFNTVSAKWGDYDVDGDLDIALIGKINGDDTRDHLQVYRNDNGIFNEVTIPVQPNIYNGQGSVSWGDYDNDNDLDLLVTGLGPNEAGDDLVTTIVRNDEGAFVASGIILPGVAVSCAEWGDYDGDGDLDIAMQGEKFDTDHLTAILRNDGEGVFTNINAALSTVFLGSVDWGDFDNDGDVDLLFTGLDGVAFAPATHVYRNDEGVMVEVNDALPGLWGKGIWGDYDGDNDLDIVLTGFDKEYSIITHIYENTEKLNQRITFDAITNRTYGDADFALTATSGSGLAISYELVSGPASISENSVTITGIGTVVVKASQAGNADFNPAEPVQQSFTIGKAPLAISADDKTITYGDPLPALTFSYSGFVNGEDASVLGTEPTINTSASDTSDAGIYTINVNGSTADNYEINRVDGMLTIDKAEASILVGNLEQIFDGTPKEVTVTTDPQNLNFNVTYGGDNTPPTQVNTYDLEVVVDDINYQGQASETFSIILISGEQEEDLNSAMKFYPVPAKGELKFSGDLENIQKVLIYDLRGKVILNASLVARKVDISQINPGTYIINLVDSQGIKQLTNRIIIR